MEPIDEAELHRLRRRGDLDEARALLVPYLSEPGPDALVLAGRLDLDAGDPAGALARFDAAIAAAPAEPDAYPWRIAALHRLSRREEAEHAAVEATRAFPGHPGVWVAYARFLNSTLREAEALAATEAALRAAPDYPAAAYWRVIALNALNRYDAAEAAARDAVGRLPGEPVVHAVLGAVLSSMGRYPEAVEAYAEADAAGGDRPDIVGDRALRLRWLGRNEEAERLLRAAARRFPNSPDPCWRLADLAFRLGREEEALELADEAVRRAPWSRVAETERVEVLAACRRTDEAEEAARAAVAARPWDPDLHVLLARLLADQDRDEEALESCDRALELEPSLMPAMIKRADILAYLGRDDVQATLEGYLERYPDDTELLSRLARLHWAHNRETEALRLYERVLGLDPYDLIALTGRIAELRDLNRLDEALAAAEQARDLRPYDTEIGDELTACLWLLGRHTDALDRLDEVLRTDPYLEDLQARRVDWLRFLGRYAEAETAVRRAVELIPGFPALHVALALTQRDRGRAEEAVATLRAALDRFGPAYLLFFGRRLLGILVDDLARYAEAHELADRLVAEYPDLEDAQHERFKLLCVTRRFAEAEALATAYLDRRPYATSLHRGLAHLYWQLDRHAEALDRIETLLGYEPDWFAAWGLKISVLRDEGGRLDEAEAVAREAIDRYPHAGRFHRDAAWILSDRGRYAEALAAFDRALAIDPADVDALRGRISMLRRLRRVEEATAAAEEALAAQPDARLPLLRSLASVHDVARRWDDALRCLDEALELDPYDRGAAAAKATVLRSARRVDEAERILAPLAERFTEDRELRAALAWTRRDQKRLTEAAADFERLLAGAAGPDERVAALYGLGWVDLDRDDPERARQRFAQAEEDRPGSAGASLAWALLRSGDPRLLPEAERLCLDWLDGRPRDAETCVCLGVVNFRLGRPAQAEYYLRRSVELDPYGGSHVDLGALYVQLGRYDEAREQLDRALARDWFDAQAHVEAGNLRLKELAEAGVDGGAAAGAAGHFRQALAIDPANGAATIGLALALAQGGEGGLAAAENVLRTSLRGPCDHPRWQLHLTLARLLIQNGDLTQRAPMYEEALVEAKAAIEQKPDEPDPYFVAGVAEYKLGQDGADLTLRSLHRIRARAHFKRHGTLKPGDVEAGRVLRLIEQDAHAARRSAYSGLALSGLSAVLLTALWAAFLTTDRVTPAMMMTLTPVMVGLVALGLVLPLLVRLKLPGGVEADLAASLSQISSGPPGTPEPSGAAAGFGRGDIVVTPGPHGVVGRRE